MKRPIKIVFDVVFVALLVTGYTSGVWAVVQSYVSARWLVPRLVISVTLVMAVFGFALDWAEHHSFKSAVGGGVVGAGAGFVLNAIGVLMGLFLVWFFTPPPE